MVRLSDCTVLISKPSAGYARPTVGRVRIHRCPWLVVFVARALRRAGATRVLLIRSRRFLYVEQHAPWFSCSTAYSPQGGLAARGVTRHRPRGRMRFCRLTPRQRRAVPSKVCGMPPSQLNASQRLRRGGATRVLLIRSRHFFCVEQHAPWFSCSAMYRLAAFLSGCLEAEAEIGKFRIPLNLIRLRPA
jgi:hypothetical protein